MVTCYELTQTAEAFNDRYRSFPLTYMWMTGLPQRRNYPNMVFSNNCSRYRPTDLYHAIAQRINLSVHFSYLNKKKNLQVGYSPQGSTIVNITTSESIVGAAS